MSCTGEKAVRGRSVHIFQRPDLSSVPSLSLSFRQTLLTSSVRRCSAWLTHSELIIDGIEEMGAIQKQVYEEPDGTRDLGKGKDEFQMGELAQAARRL